MFNNLLRFFGAVTAYQPGAGRIVSVSHNSSSGVAINEDNALTIPAFLHGVRLISQTIGSQKCDLIHRLDRGEEIARAHPVHKLLHDEPNEYQTPSDFKATKIAQAVIHGNGYSYIERNGNFRPTALIPLPPDKTRPLIDGKSLAYVTVIDGKQIILDPYEVFHLKGFGTSPLAGLPLVQLMKDTLGLSKAEAEFAAKFFSSGANMGGVVEMPGALSDKAKANLKASMDREYGGLGNAFRTLFLEDGMKYTRTGVEPDKAQFIEGRTFSLDEIGRVLSLAPHLLYNLARSTNNNIEHQGIEAVTYSFKPWAVKFQDEANRKLLYESEKNDYYVRIDLTPLMAGDAQTQANVDKANFDMLAITPNERRAKIGLNPVEGGDELFLNTAYLPLSVAVQKALADVAAAEAAVTDPEDIEEIEAAETQGEDKDTSTDHEPPADAAAGVADPDGQPGPSVNPNMIDDEMMGARSVLRPVISDAVSRMLRREQKAIENARKKYSSDADFTGWYDRWETEQRSHIAEVLAPIGEAMQAAGLQLNGYAEYHLQQSRAALNAAIVEGDRVADAVNHLLGETK